MESRHAEGLVGLKDRVEVVATVDTELERAKYAAEVLGARTAVTDYREILDDVDTVLVVLPNHLHHEVGMECLQAGKHVLMEKPLANTEDHCLELIHTAAERNLVLTTAYVMRFNPLVLKLKELIDDGTLGDVFQVSIWTEQFTKRPVGNWHNTAATLGGGQFFSHGCHYVDLLMWFLGDPVRGTHMGNRLGTQWLEKEGTSNATIEFANGALGYHFGTWGARGTKLRYSMHAHGTEAMAELELRLGELRLYQGDTVRTVMSGDRNSKRVQEQLTHFFDAVDGSDSSVNNGAASIQGLRVIWRLYEAEQRGMIADLSGLGLDAPNWDKPGLAQLPTSVSSNQSSRC
jgi:predicted dehydrogenase